MGVGFEGGDGAESGSGRAIPATEPQEVGQGAGGLSPSHCTYN